MNSVIRFPFYLKDSNFKEPNHPLYYMLTSKGLFLVKNFERYRAKVKIEEGLPWLEDQEEEIVLEFPKIPKYDFERIMAFFYAVYKLYDSEAIALLYLNKENQYKIVIPHQVIQVRRIGKLILGNYNLDYSIPVTPDGYMRVGTIHSHADLKAFYSSTDMHDSQKDDSINIVVGDLNKKKPSFYVCFVMNAEINELEIDALIEGYQRPSFPIPVSWLDRVKLK
jgi:hypothetical protein